MNICDCLIQTVQDYPGAVGVSLPELWKLLKAKQGTRWKLTKTVKAEIWEKLSAHRHIDIHNMMDEVGVG